MNNHISAFSKQAYEALISSDYLYSSNYELQKIEDKGSITDSLEGIDLFNGKKIQKSLLTDIAQQSVISIMSVAITVFCAPVGTVWHGAMASTYFIRFLTSGCQKENWEKVKDHSAAFFTDFTFMLKTAFKVFIIASSIVFGLMEGFPMTLLSIGVGGGILLGTFSPLDVASSVTYDENERSAFIKSILLKRDFGICNQDGKLLKQDPLKDGEILIPEQLHVYTPQGDLVNRRRELAEKFVKLSEKIRNINVGHLLSYPPTADQLKRLTNDLLRLRPKFSVCNLLHKPIDPNQVKKWQTKAYALEENINRLSGLLKTCFNTELDSLFSSEKVEMDSFPLSFDECKGLGAHFLPPLIAG